MAELPPQWVTKIFTLFSFNIAFYGTNFLSNKFGNLLSSISKYKLFFGFNDQMNPM